MDIMKDFINSLPDDPLPRKLSREEIMAKIRNQGEDSLTDTDLRGYERNDPAKPELIDALLDDLGGFDGELRRVTKAYLTERIRTGERDQCPWLMKDLDLMALFFVDGYQARTKEEMKR